MTKADIVKEIAQSTGVEKTVVMTVVESFMENVKDSMIKGDDVFLRGFGSFIIKNELQRLPVIFRRIRRSRFRNM